MLNRPVPGGLLGPVVLACEGVLQPVGSRSLRWNGTAWTQVPVPSPGTVAALSAVAATSATSAWAVGRSSTTIVGQALAVHCC